MTQLHYIAVEGPIGVGKSTLARRLAEALGFSLLLELPEENPFLPAFYEDPARHALAVQLFFLLQRVRQMEGLRQADLFRPGIVSDFMWEKDRLFAALNLGEEELSLYNQLHDTLKPRAAAPDLVVYLRAGVGFLQGRIRRRGVVHEQAISGSYLQDLVNAYDRFFDHYQVSPVLRIDAESHDFEHHPQDFAALLQRIHSAGARAPRPATGNGFLNG